MYDLLSIFGLGIISAENEDEDEGWEGGRNSSLSPFYILSSKSMVNIVCFFLSQISVLHPPQKK